MPRRVFRPMSRLSLSLDSTRWSSSARAARSASSGRSASSPSASVPESIRASSGSSTRSTRPSGARSSWSYAGTPKLGTAKKKSKSKGGGGGGGDPHDRMLDRLKAGALTLLVEREGRLVHASDRGGLKPLYDGVIVHPELFEGAEVADRVVGLAAAYLLVHAR